MVCDYMKLQLAGKPYPRTCPECKLGPCKHSQPVATTPAKPSIDEQIAEIKLAIGNIEQSARGRLILHKLHAILSTLEAYKRITESAGRPEPVAEVHVILDGPPSHESGRFVECENADGKSINAGRWEQRGEYWHLIINSAPQPDGVVVPSKMTLMNAAFALVCPEEVPKEKRMAMAQKLLVAAKESEQTHVRVPVDKLTISDCYRFGIDISSIRSTATGKESE